MIVRANAAAIPLRDESNGRFLKGQHWRERKPFWDREWTREEYVRKGRSAHDIAIQFGVTDNAIHFWLKRHGIKTRTVSEARKLKHWTTPTGAANPMYGRRGRANPNFKGGNTAERQQLYARAEWRAVLREVYRRDSYHCRRCDSPQNRHNALNAHHIRPWAEFPELRLEPPNLVTLCGRCHRWVHSNANVGREFLVGR